MEGLRDLQADGEDGEWTAEDAARLALLENHSLAGNIPDEYIDDVRTNYRDFPPTQTHVDQDEYTSYGPALGTVNGYLIGLHPLYLQVLAKLRQFRLDHGRTIQHSS